MIKLGGLYRYRVGNFIMKTKFEIIGQEQNHWIGRSYDSFESQWYFNDRGQLVGTREAGIGDAINVWLVLQ